MALNRIYFLTFPLIVLIFFSGINNDDNIKSLDIINNCKSRNTWEEILIDSIGIPKPAITLALSGYFDLKQQNQLRNDSLLTIIDFSKPSDDKRLYILDLRNEKILKTTLVAHGRNSGVENAETFSNRINSNMSSLGFFVTRDTYQGKHGYSLRIEGMNKGLNDNAFKRAVVIHGADYVSERFIKKTGRLGRSFGCPALPPEDTKEVIDLIKNGSCLFIYHPSLITISPSDQQRLL